MAALYFTAARSTGASHAASALLLGQLAPRLGRGLVEGPILAAQAGRNVGVALSAHRVQEAVQQVRLLRQLGDRLRRLRRTSRRSGRADSSP